MRAWPPRVDHSSPPCAWSGSPFRSGRPVVVFGQHYNQCDNEAGTCIRHRQLVAIVLIQAGAPIAAFIALAGCVLTIRRGRVPTLLVVAAVLATAVSAAVLVADPIPRLNDRWDGWLGKPIVDVPE